MSGSSYYQILVTSTRRFGDGVAVHTTVLEFPYQQTADKAFHQLENSQQGVLDKTGVTQAYTKLY